MKQKRLSKSKVRDFIGHDLYKHIKAESDKYEIRENDQNDIFHWAVDVMTSYSLLDSVARGKLSIVGLDENRQPVFQNTN